MTTPPTPADWYPDPENPAGLRYWDGTSWTEHRAPAPASAVEPPAETPVAPADEVPASEQATSVVSLPEPPATDQPTTVVPSGAHRAADEEPSAGETYAATPSQPYDTHPPTSYEPATPDPAPWDAPLPSWDAPPAEQPFAAPPTPSYEAASFAPPPAPCEPPTPPAGPSAGGPNKKLIIGILGGAAAILLALVLVIVFVVIRQGGPTVTTSQTTPSATSKTTSSKSSSESSAESSPTPTPPPTGGQGSDGDYTFSVAGTETGDTITSNVSDAVQTTADGMFYVVYVDVSNTGASPLTFVATFQQLSAGGQTFPLDDEATAFLGGTIANISPGDKVETPLVYDVPVGTTPDSVLLRADPSTPGVTLPLQ